MHKITFYPLGNADCSLVELKNGKKILFDFANMKCPDDQEDKRIDLVAELNKSVKGDFDVVCFTHGDRDHTLGLSDYFHLQHAQKYQTEGRKKIHELWVPANLLTDTTLDDDAKILRQEARHRLINNSGIRIFSRADLFKKWCNDHNEFNWEDIEHLIVDAGTMVPGFEDRNSSGVEFFVHSPFASETQKMDRNSQAIVLQATFNDVNESKLILSADICHEVWDDIVKLTKHFHNEDKLQWDIFHLPHHCSYLSLSSEKQEDITIPTDQVKWLFETQGNKNARIISPSKPIPIKGTKEDDDCQPPHRQAANYHKSVAKTLDGEFIVTMEYPSAQKPEPLTLELTDSGIQKLDRKKREAEELEKRLAAARIVTSNSFIQKPHAW